MNYFYITGASRGIGKAIAEKLLQNEENTVFGISRTVSLEHPNYHHYSIDFNDLDAVKPFRFSDHPEALSVVLINNSGYLGPVFHLGNKNAEEIIKTFNINIISAAVLMNEFCRTYNALPLKKMIINISSGAARFPIESWSEYCSTKAAMDMYSRVLDLEQSRLQTEHPVKVYSVAPGIIETHMQEEIRQVDPENFSEVKRFRDYKENNELKSTETVADEIQQLMLHPERFPEVVMEF